MSEREHRQTQSTSRTKTRAALPRLTGEKREREEGESSRGGAGKLTAAT